MFVAASQVLADRWSKFKASIDAAAGPHTGQSSLPLSPLYLLELPGARTEMDTATHQAPPGSNVRAMPVVGLDGRIGFDVIW